MDKRTDVEEGINPLYGVYDVHGVDDGGQNCLFKSRGLEGGDSGQENIRGGCW